MAFTLSQKSALGARCTAKAPAKASRSVRLVCRAQADVDRRQVLGAIAASVPFLAGASPAFAAYGEAANVFGRATNTTGFVPYAGEGFSLAIPSKWNPSKERDFGDVVFRYEDNGDAVNNALVIVSKTDKSSIEGYGSPEKFLEEFSFLLGKQSFSGETLSEGGFAPNRVSAASVLDVSTEKDKKGKTFYNIEVLTRTGDGNEGGRHQLIKATVSNGQLYLLKVQIGDKRWFKGAKREAEGLVNSFSVA